MGLAVRRGQENFERTKEMAGQILFVGKSDSRLERTWARIEAKGHRVISVRSRKPALETINSIPPHVVVVDTTVTRTGVEKLCRQLKRYRPEISILLLTDDEQPPPKFPHHRTLSKAASYRRFHDVLSKMIQEQSDHILRVGSLSLDLASRTVRSQKGTNSLCPKEAQLLATFMRQPGTVLRHEFLMKTIWETDFVEDLGTLWTHICSVRRKIEPHANRRVYLHTVRGMGYRLDVWPPPDGA